MLLTYTRKRAHARARAHKHSHAHTVSTHRVTLIWAPTGLIIYESIYLCLVWLWTQVLRSHNIDNYKTTPGQRLFYLPRAQWPMSQKGIADHQTKKRKKIQGFLYKSERVEMYCWCRGDINCQRHHTRGLPKIIIVYLLPSPRPPPRSFLSLTAERLRCHYM